MRNWWQTAEPVRQEVGHLCRAVKIAWEILKILSSSYIPKAMDLAITSWLDKLIATPWVIVVLYDLSWLLAISLVIGFTYAWIDPLRPSTKFRVLAPRLEQIMQDGIRYADLYWMEDKLTKLKIPCPPVHTPGEFNPTDKYQDDSGQILPRWNEFLMIIVSLAETGDIKKARNTPEHLTSLQCVLADPF